VETTRKSQSSSKLNPKKISQPNDFAKYSGLAFELLGILVVGIGAGYALDNYFETSVPFITIIFSLLSLIGMIMYLLQKLPKG